MSTIESALESVVGRGGVTRLDSPALREAIPLARPANEEQLQELVRYASRDARKLLPIGFGSKLGWCEPPEHVDFALSTRALAGVVAYEPADGTLTARAGSTLSELHEITRAEGNHLTPDVPLPSTATLGGVLAAGQSGLDRLRHGPIRHHVLGMRAVLADGTIARSGGRLVKNVTGFDLHRLYCGSRGTLCVIVEASLRLFPGPAHEVSLRSTLPSSHKALRAARSIADAGVNAYPVVVENLGAAADQWNVHVLLAGQRETIEWEAETAQRFLPDARVDRDEAARVRFAELRDLGATRATPSVHIGMLPSKLADALDLIERATKTWRGQAPCSIQPSIATVDVFPIDAHRRGQAGEGDAASLDPDHYLEFVRALLNTEFDVRLRNAPPPTMRGFAASTRSHPGLEWMRRLKRALDPGGVFVSDDRLSEE